MDKHFGVFSCELGDVYRNRYDGKCIDEDGQSDYESVNAFEENFESEDRNMKEYWETFVNSLRGKLI